MYLRILGTKSTLHWGLEQSIDPVLSRIDQNFIRLDGLAHVVDICLSVYAEGGTVMFRAAALRSFATQRGVSYRTYHPMLATAWGNLQGKAPAGEQGQPSAAISCSVIVNDRA